MRRVVQQIMGVNPFDGDSKPSRVKLFMLGTGRTSMPFPHPWNYLKPIEIMTTYFCEADREQGSAQHNRYLDVPFFNPVLITRDPGIIKAILMITSDQPGHFDRDTLSLSGISRVAGKDTLIYSNGPLWRLQKKLAAPAFGKSTLFQPERFHEFEETFRHTIRKRLDALQSHLKSNNTKSIQIRLEPEIKVVMLEMLVNNFFGAEISYEELRDRFTPALERVIDHIVSDTVINRTEIPVNKMPSFTKKIVQYKKDFADFEKLTDLVLAPRKTGKGLWKQFKSDAPDEALRANIRAFLAGALEATSSFACWALWHLSRNEVIQEEIFDEVKTIDSYTPDNLNQAQRLNQVMEETLRLTPSLYFLPRKATADTWVETSDKRRMMVPKGTHILLDIWHANRCEDFWGVKATGYPASDFAPDRWNIMESRGVNPKEMLHFGFGHGPRVCPGKFLGQLEVGLVVGAVIKKFKLRAVNANNSARAGVSTKPLDGVLVDLELR